MMRALTIEPGRPQSIQMDHVPDPSPEHGTVLARILAVGICGTDRELIAGDHGRAPPGQRRLIIGHESIAEVEEAPPDCGLATGDLVVGIVRRPDPVPCRYCGAGEWDMCVNGRYLERGIKELHGYCSDYIRVEPEFAIRVAPALGDLGVLLEPASIVTKAWDHVERIGSRTQAWSPRHVLVTGAGPIGLLAALIGAQRGLEVHVMDRANDGPKPQLVRDLGAKYHQGTLPNSEEFSPDIVMECTGAPSVILDVLCRSAPSGIVCLTGLSSGRHRLGFDLAALNRSMVLENDVVFGSVNANRSHYESAAGSLAAADREWLSRLISRRVPLVEWPSAFERRDGDVKVILDFTR